MTRLLESLQLSRPLPQLLCLPACTSANVAITVAAMNCRFFEDYKKNENKEVKVDEFLGAELARKTITESMVNKSHTTNLISLLLVAMIFMHQQSSCLSCIFASTKCLPSSMMMTLVDA